MRPRVSHVTAQKLEIDENGDLFMSEIIADGHPPLTKRVELADLKIPLLKTVEAQIIIRRDFYSPTGEPKTFLGLQKLRFSIPKGEDYRYYYLVYVPKKMSTVCLSIVNTNDLNRITQTIDLCADFTKKRLMKKIGTLKEIEPEKARYLLRSKETLGVFGDDFSEQRV